MTLLYIYILQQYPNNRMCARNELHRTNLEIKDLIYLSVISYDMTVTEFVTYLFSLPCFGSSWLYSVTPYFYFHFIFSYMIFQVRKMDFTIWLSKGNFMAEVSKFYDYFWFERCSSLFSLMILSMLCCVTSWGFIFYFYLLVQLLFYILDLIR